MDLAHQSLIATASQENSAGASGVDSRAIAEVSIGFLLVLLALWSYGRAQLLLSGVAFFWMLFATLRSRPTAEELGLGVTGMGRTLWIVALAAIASLLAVGVSLRLHTFHAVFRNYAMEWGLLAYIGWALVQQFLLQDFFLARLLRIAPTRTAAVVSTGLLFAVVHVPNPVLVVATTVWGIVACALFLRYRNLYVLALAHAIVGMCLAVTVPNAVHHHMRVGLGYLRWHPQTGLAQRQMTRVGNRSLPQRSSVVH